MVSIKDEDAKLLSYFKSKILAESKYKLKNTLETRPYKVYDGINSKENQINLKNAKYNRIFNQNNAAHRNQDNKKPFTKFIHNFDLYDTPIKNIYPNMDSKIWMDLENLYDRCKKNKSLCVLPSITNIDKFMMDLKELGFLQRKKRRIGQTLEEKRNSHVSCEFQRKTAINSALSAISDFLPNTKRLNRKQIVFLAFKQILELHDENFYLKKKLADVFK